MKIFVTLLFLGFFILSKSQENSTINNLVSKLETHTKQDTIKATILLELSAAYYGINPDKMIQYSEEALHISEKLSFKKGIGSAYQLQGAANFTRGDFGVAESYFLKALENFQKINYYGGIILCYSNLGNIKIVQNEYPEALKYYQSSIRTGEKAKDLKLIGYAYGNMGIIYSELKNYDLALKYFNGALESHTKTKNKEGIAASYGNIGNVHFNKNEFDFALKYFNDALKLNIELGSKSGIAREYGNIASVYSAQKRYQESFDNYLEALKINKELKNKKGISLNYQGIGEYYLDQNSLDKALDYTKKSNEIAHEIGVSDIQKDTYENLSRIFEKKGEADSAYIYFKKYIEIKENIESENNRKQISRLEIQYEFDATEEKYKNKQLLDQENLKQQQLLLALNNSKLNESNKERDLVRLNYLKTQSELESEQIVKNAQKKQLTIAQKEIELQDKEIELNKVTLQSQEREKWFYIIGLGLLGIIGILLLYQNHQRKKNNDKLLMLNSQLDIANKAKLQFLGILNHDLRGPVSKLIHFLHLQKESPELLDEETKLRMEQKTISSAENLLESMEDLLLWSKGEMNNFEPKFKEISLESVFLEIQKYFYSYDSTAITFENSENIYMRTDVDYLKTIMRNLTGNSVKATENIEKAAIIWKTWKENDQIYLSISDNGIGSAKENFKTLYDDKQSMGITEGLGLHLVRDLANAIHCKIKVDSQPYMGTTITLHFLNFS